MNPRPKCYVCNKACRKNQQSLSCHICKKHVHRKCANLTVVDIRMMKLSNILYSCKSCVDDSTPFTEVENISSNVNHTKFDTDVILDPMYLNNLFLPSEEGDTDVTDKIPNLCFRPIPAKYFAANDISLDSFESACTSDISKVISTKFSSVGINMRSLSNAKNFAKLQAFLSNLCFQPSVIAINETYLRDNEPGPHCDVNGYNFIFNNLIVCIVHFHCTL